MKIQPIVEGHGDVKAVPELIRRLFNFAQAYDCEVLKPIRRKQSELLHEDQLKRSIRLAKLKGTCDAILVLFEAEDDCPKDLGPRLGAWAQSEAGDIPCAVVLAHREFEAWFLGALESLRGKRHIRNDASFDQDPESVRGAKEALESYMEKGYFYLETADQVALSALFDMKAAYRRCRSFRHLVKKLNELLHANSIRPGINPPADWIQ